MSSSEAMDTGAPVQNQTTYSEENFIQAALRSSPFVRNAIRSFTAPLNAKIDELHHQCYDLRRDIEAKAGRLSRVIAANDRLAADLDNYAEDISRLRRQRDQAKEDVSALRAQFHPPTSPIRPLLAYLGDIMQWPQFVQDLHTRIAAYPQMYRSERLKCLLLLDFMHGPSREWAKLFLATQDGIVKAPELDNFQVLLAKATLAWGDNGKEAQAGLQLLNTRLQTITNQGLINYHQSFEALAVMISWSEPVILQCYKRGLTSSIRNQLEAEGVAEELQAVQEFVIETVNEVEKQDGEVNTDLYDRALM